jgi:conserved hypothetical protein
MKEHETILKTGLNGKNRSQIRTGLCVDIIQKQDQRSGKTTRGIVRDILTRSPTHPHGIKVRLVSGQVGRVSLIIPCEYEKE